MTLPAVTSDTINIQNLYYLAFWMSVVVFVLVESLLLYSAFAFRRRRADEMPEQNHGNSRMELMWTVVPAIVVLFLFFISLDGMTKLTGAGSYAQPLNHVHPIDNTDAARRIDEAKQTDEVVTITGRQWFWQYRYQKEGVSASSQVNATSTGELMVPAGKSVRLDLNSTDVIHAWFVPQLSGMIYVNPGERSYIWFTAPVGEYYGQCNFFCGNQHAQMISKVKVVSQTDFDAWVKSKKTAQQNDVTAQQGDPSRGVQLYMDGAFKSVSAIEAAQRDTAVAAQTTGMSTQEVADVIAYLDTLQ